MLPGHFLLKQVILEDIPLPRDNIANRIDIGVRDLRLSRLLSGRRLLLIRLVRHRMQLLRYRGELRIAALLRLGSRLPIRLARRLLQRRLARTRRRDWPRRRGSWLAGLRSWRRRRFLAHLLKRALVLARPAGTRIVLLRLY